MADDQNLEKSSPLAEEWEIVKQETIAKTQTPGKDAANGQEGNDLLKTDQNIIDFKKEEAKLNTTPTSDEAIQSVQKKLFEGDNFIQAGTSNLVLNVAKVLEKEDKDFGSGVKEEKNSKENNFDENKETEKEQFKQATPILEKAEESDEEERKNADNSGDETADTDKEEEEHRKRIKEAKRKGTKLVHRASFKRDRVDRQYDSLPWAVGAACRLLGLKLAPANIPLHRRLETFAVLLWMSTFLFMGIAATWFLFYLYFYTQYWWISLCYLSWYIPDRTVCNRGGRRINWVRNWGIWKHFRNFFPIHVIKTVELSPDHNYIMCYHPHGILAAGAFCTFATEGTGWHQLFPGLTPYLLTLEVLFLMPFYRELLLCSGAVSATRGSMDYLLGKEGTGRALCLVPGGAPESLDCHPGQVILHLNKRFGFAKMALRHGASLVPMFGFGENDIYDQMKNPRGSFIRKVQDSLQRVFGLAPCLFQGRGVLQYSFGFVPFRKPIYLVVGEPIHVDAVKKPTSEQIVSLHQKYKEALIALYNKHKEQYARDPSVPIQFI